ncbi:hypothetical protein HDU96_009032 [Phlyctochytrium bullatum]|nr:hypothetical protein HDU96_009032 [Phlyctochytrium bullatum]
MTSSSNANSSPQGEDCALVASLFPSLHIPASDCCDASFVDNDSIDAAGSSKEEQGEEGFVDSDGHGQGSTTLARKTALNIGCRQDNGRIHEISLFVVDLNGPIPPAISRLTYLQRLHLSSCKLNGTIPAELGSLSNLQVLDLGYNTLEGGIPPELGRLSNLEVLRLKENRLNGSIPVELAQLDKLQFLDVSSNKLSGAIPSRLGRLQQLEYIGAAFNELTGDIPQDLGDASSLHVLWLPGNNLTGPIPQSLGRLKTLETLRVENNFLSGNVPDFVAGLDYKGIEGNCLNITNLSRDTFAALTQRPTPDCLSIPTTQPPSTATATATAGASASDEPPTTELTGATSFLLALLILFALALFAVAGVLAYSRFWLRPRRAALKGKARATEPWEPWEVEMEGVGRVLAGLGAKAVGRPGPGAGVATVEVDQEEGGVGTGGSMSRPLLGSSGASVASGSASGHGAWMEGSGEVVFGGEEEEEEEEEVGHGMEMGYHAIAMTR